MSEKYNVYGTLVSYFESVNLPQIEIVAVENKGFHFMDESLFHGDNTVFVNFVKAEMAKKIGNSISEFLKENDGFELSFLI